MLDLSEEPLEENIGTCVEYLERMSKVDLLLEMELGVTGGEEDGVDNTDIDSSRLYTQPEEVWETYEALSKVDNGRFTVAAAFGNVHGVYAPGNVELTPVILHNTQKFISEKLGGPDKKPVNFVFHGGSGSSREDIRYAIEAGVIKMNIDTDTQWAFWDGVRQYEAKNRDYLQGQIGNPEGATKPNKKCALRTHSPSIMHTSSSALLVILIPSSSPLQVLRPAHGAAVGRGVDGQAAGRGDGGPQLHQRRLSSLVEYRTNSGRGGGASAQRPPSLSPPPPGGCGLRGESNGHCG
jgi:ketose-bisphosphate aldolase